MIDKRKILTQIAYTISKFPYFDVTFLTVGMTKDVYDLIMPTEYLISHYNLPSTVFGCKIKVFPCNGLWWIVGYDGTIEEVDNNG